MHGNSNPNNELVKLCHDKREMMDDVTALFLEAHGGVNIGSICHFNLSLNLCNVLSCFITEALRD
mgnify:CR=1 FL=1